MPSFSPLDKSHTFVGPMMHVPLTTMRSKSTHTPTISKKIVKDLTGCCTSVKTKRRAKGNSLLSRTQSSDKLLGRASASFSQEGTLKRPFRFENNIPNSPKLSEDLPDFQPEKSPPEVMKRAPQNTFLTNSNTSSSGIADMNTQNTSIVDAYGNSVGSIPPGVQYYQFDDNTLKRVIVHENDYENFKNKLPSVSYHKDAGHTPGAKKRPGVKRSDSSYSKMSSLTHDFSVKTGYTGRSAEPASTIRSAGSLAALNDNQTIARVTEFQEGTRQQNLQVTYNQYGQIEIKEADSQHLPPTTSAWSRGLDRKSVSQDSCKTLNSHEDVVIDQNGHKKVVRKINSQSNLLDGGMNNHSIIEDSGTFSVSKFDTTHHAGNTCSNLNNMQKSCSNCVNCQGKEAPSSNEVQFIHNGQIFSATPIANINSQRPLMGQNPMAQSMQQVRPLNFQSLPVLQNLQNNPFIQPNFMPQNPNMLNPQVPNGITQQPATEHFITPDGRIVECVSVGTINKSIAKPTRCLTPFSVVQDNKSHLRPSQADQSLSQTQNPYGFPAQDPNFDRIGNFNIYENVSSIPRRTSSNGSISGSSMAKSHTTCTSLKSTRTVNSSQRLPPFKINKINSVPSSNSSGLTTPNTPGLRPDSISLASYDQSVHTFQDALKDLTNVQIAEEPQPKLKSILVKRSDSDSSKTNSLSSKSSERTLVPDKPTREKESPRLPRGSNNQYLRLGDTHS